MRHAVRQLLRTPTFTAVAILTLAIGIATNTAIYGIVDALTFKPIRGTHYEQVFSLSALDPQSERGALIQIPDYETLVAHPPAGVAAIAAFDGGGGGLLQMPGRAEHVGGWRVSAGYASVHRVRAQVGRWINADDNVGGALDPTETFLGRTYPVLFGRPGADAAVISDRIWREWFNEATDIAERGAITLNHHSMRIVGVAPPGFESAIDVWVPFGQRRLLTRDELDRNGQFHKNAPVTQPGLQVLVRVADDAPVAEVAARMTAVAASRPPTAESPAGVMRLSPRRGDDRLLRTGYVILGFAALIFLAACANLGNMLYARATEREGELAVRLALGATRMAIFRLLLAEAAVICVTASAAGLVLATGALQLFADAFPAFQVNYQRRMTLDLSLDWRIFAYAAGAGIVAAGFVSVASLWRSSRVSLLTRMAAAGPAVVAKTEGRTLRTMFVSVQITAAVLLLIAMGILLESASKQLDQRLLFDTGSLVAARLELPADYDESRGPHFFDQVLTRVRAIDGVSAAGLADALPGGGAPTPRHGRGSIIAEAPPRGLSGTPTRLDGQWVHVSPGLIDTLGIDITRGRDFRPDDQAGSDPVVLVSESAARRLWPGEEPLGNRITCCDARYWRTVVGVVADPVESLGTAQAMDVGEAMTTLSRGTGIGMYVFVPATQHYSRGMLVVLRSSSPRGAVQPLRDAVVAIDPAVPVFDAGPVDATQFARSAAERAVRTLAGLMGAIALGIAVFGVYAVVAYFVSRRAREFGLRLALGSTRGQVVKLVVDHAIHMVLIGLVPGVLFASWGTRYFQAELVKLRPSSLAVWIAVPLVMLAAGIIAAYIPARRAAKIDPYRALKEL